MAIDKVFLSFAVSTTALILILLTGPIVLQQQQEKLKMISIQIDNQTDTNGRYINLTLAFVKNQITEQLTNITSNQTDNINNMSHKLDIITQKLNASS